MTRFFVKVALAAAVFFSSIEPALADQQVSGDTWGSAGLAPFYGRSDGLFFHQTYKSPRLIGNGDGFMPLGPTFYENFSYGDGLGVLCEAVGRTGGFSVVAGANAACDTTCGNADCVAAFEAALADAGDVIACSDATADVCICQTTSLDEVKVGCGADWEAPALGVSLMTFASGVKLAHVALLAQDIGPDMDASSLDIGGDQTDNDGVEILSGMYGASGRPLVPNVDPAFKFCATFSIEDISGTDEFWIGFRDATAPNATFNSYNSYAVIGFDAADGDWATETEDDGAGTTTTDVAGLTNATDGSSHKACVLVSDAGVVSYQVDGATPTGTASYTLDAGEAVVPFIHFLHASDVAGEVDLTVYEVSYQ